MEEIRRALEGCDVMAVPASNPAPRLGDDATLSSAASKPAATPEPDTFDLGKPFDEATLFRVSHACESATDCTHVSQLAGAAAAAKPASQRSVHLAG